MTTFGLALNCLDLVVPTWSSRLSQYTTATVSDSVLEPLTNPQTPSTPPKAPTDTRYAELVREIKTAGLMERRSGVYAFRCALTFASFAAGWIAFFLVGESWWQIAVAVYLAGAFTQVAFLAHDGGHRQAFGSRKANDALLLVTGNLGVGIASGWWFGNHNRHHAHPNNTELDPDVNLRFFAYSDGQTGLKSGIDKFVARYQHALYFPLLTLLGGSLHIESVVMVLRRNVTRPLLEGSLIVVHQVLFFGALIAVLGSSPMKLAVFLLVNQMLFGLYLGSTFAPNHKGMEMYEDTGDEPSFVDRQIRTSRNVRGNHFMSYAMGGLNHQIEHHLFPAMPRPNLIKARPIVMNFCKRHDLPYAEASAFDSVRQVVAHFKKTRLSSYAVGSAIQPTNKGKPEVLSLMTIANG